MYLLLFVPVLFVAQIVFIDLYRTSKISVDTVFSGMCFLLAALIGMLLQVDMIEMAFPAKAVVYVLDILGVLVLIFRAKRILARVNTFTKDGTQRLEKMAAIITALLTILIVLTAIVMGGGD